jgi:hypothetical protein
LRLVGIMLRILGKQTFFCDFDGFVIIYMNSLTSLPLSFTSYSLINPPIDSSRLSSVANRKSKSKETYVKNKTFEFPNNYLNSLINSNTEFKSEGLKNNQYYQNMIKDHDRRSSKKRSTRIKKIRNQTNYLAQGSQSNRKKNPAILSRNGDNIVNTTDGHSNKIYPVFISKDGTDQIPSNWP